MIEWRWWREKQEQKAAEQRAATKARIDRLAPLRDPDAIWDEPVKDITTSFDDAMRRSTLSMSDEVGEIWRRSEELYKQGLISDEELIVARQQFIESRRGTKPSEFSEQFEQLRATLRLNEPKKITDLLIDWTRQEIDVTTFSDPVRRTIPGSAEMIVRDQEGEPVPEELRQKVLDIVGIRTGVSTKELDHRLKELLADWNSDGPDPMKEAPPGHQQGCVYRGSHHFACTCQPPTLWGKVKLWYCDCCEEPRALIQYGVCENCEGHEYSDPMQVEADHKAAKTYA